MSIAGLKIFISYAHEDETFRRDLDKHLAALKREGLIEEWHDRKIWATQDWDKEIHENLDQSHIIVLLISPDFMASSYCNEVEVKRAMQRYEMGTARVMPVIVRRADWQGAPFSKLQAVPTNVLPISEWESRDAAFVDVVQHLRNVCQEVAAIPGNPANPYVVAEVGDWYEAEIMIDIFPTAQTKLASMRLTLVDKNDRQATVRTEIKSADLGDDEKTVEIPLDRPLEDSYGSLVSTVSSEEIPANAMANSRLIGGGTEKLFIGGKTYYTTWVEKEVEIRQGRDRMLQKGKVWMSSDIPLDGVVKMVSEIPDVMKQTIIVTDYGRGGQRARSGRGTPRSQSRQLSEEPVTLKGVIIGGWNVNISQQFGITASSTFQFDTGGLFSAQLMSPVLGMLTMQGQWQAQSRTLVLQGVQSTPLGNVPYATQISFDIVSKNTLRGRSQIGEDITFTRL